MNSIAVLYYELGAAMFDPDNLIPKHEHHGPLSIADPYAQTRRPTQTTTEKQSGTRGCRLAGGLVFAVRCPDCPSGVVR